MDYKKTTKKSETAKNIGKISRKVDRDASKTAKDFNKGTKFSRKKNPTARDFNKGVKKIEKHGSETGKTVKKAMRNRKVWD